MFWFKFANGAGGRTKTDIETYLYLFISQTDIEQKRRTIEGNVENCEFKF